MSTSALYPTFPLSDHARHGVSSASTNAAARRGLDYCGVLDVALIVPSTGYYPLRAITLYGRARDITKGKLDGRGVEIQRPICRAMRASIDLDRLGERTLRVDCDVLEADGGTRTAAITGTDTTLNVINCTVSGNSSVTMPLAETAPILARLSVRRSSRLQRVLVLRVQVGKRPKSPLANRKRRMRPSSLEFITRTSPAAGPADQHGV
jgi:hypothetical protein